MRLGDLANVVALAPGTKLPRGFAFPQIIPPPIHPHPGIPPGLALAR
jgi:hypothetical protein